MALEQRLRAAAQKENRDLTRLRQLLVFDRFLARVFHHLGETVIAKGGITLGLRLDRARTTKDVDLWMKGDAASTLDRLRELGKLLVTANVGDFEKLAWARDLHGGIVLIEDGALLRDEQEKLVRDAIAAIDAECQAGWSTACSASTSRATRSSRRCRRASRKSTVGTRDQHR